MPDADAVVIFSLGNGKLGTILKRNDTTKLHETSGINENGIQTRNLVIFLSHFISSRAC